MAPLPKQIDASLVKSIQDIVVESGILYSFSRGVLAGDFGVTIGIRRIQRNNNIAQKISRERQLKETSVFAALSHPNVLPVYGYVDTASEIWLITELPAYTLKRFVDGMYVKCAAVIKQNESEVVDVIGFRLF